VQGHIPGGRIEEVARIHLRDQFRPAEHIRGLELHLQVDVGLAIIGDIEEQPCIVIGIVQAARAGLASKAGCISLVVRT
jgi:hypothetical protein